MPNSFLFPEKSRIYKTESLDSSRWRIVNFRPDDIVIATSMKTGTTWMERIVSLLVHQDPYRVDGEIMNAPWPDGVIFESLDKMGERLEGIKHRRFFKTHVPLDGLDFNSEVKYIHVSRDTRDVFMSILNHWSLISDFLEAKGRKHPPNIKSEGDIHDLWKKYCESSVFDWEQDGWPYWSNNAYTESFWPYRKLPNILFVHYNDLSSDLDGQMRKVSEFLDIPITLDTSKWGSIVNAATFDQMKKDGDKLIPKFQKLFKGGAKSFLYKGKNGRWKAEFNEADLDLYGKMRSRYADDMMNWIENGSLIAGDPHHELN